MPLVYFDDVRLNARLDGPPGGPPVLLLGGIGMRLDLWDDVVARMPGHRILRHDPRGHGASDVPAPPYAMGALIRDAERLMDHFGMRDAVVVGLSTGGLVAQGLAVKRLDLIRGLVLSGSAARIGSNAQWQARSTAVQQGKMTEMVDALLLAMFGRGTPPSRIRAPSLAPLLPPTLAPTLARMRRMLNECPAHGWVGTAAAIAGCDFYTPTASLTLPTLGLAGDNDGLVPPDMVRETVGLIRGSRFQVMRGLGHLPCVEDPAGFAGRLAAFLQDIGHV